MLNVVCVEHGNYAGRGREYVNILCDMVRRSLTGVEYRFICYTDDPEGLDPRIQTREIPDGLKGWWCKLYLFAPGQFEGRVLFLDLDTVIMGGMSEIAKYDGDFCILEDFYRPNGYGSGLMAWKAGYGHHIWERFEKAGYPDIPGGDQAWIERCVDNADTWQQVFPGRVRSYKQHIRGNGGAPDGTWVICFHGEPRPHNCDDPYIEQFWKIGGARLAEYKIRSNTAEERIHGNVRATLGRDLPWVMPGGFPGEPERHMVLVGGGPSLNDTWRALRRRKRNGEHIWALNNTHDWLIERNIVPDALCMLDARPENAEFVRNPHPDVTYYIASQCHPSVFEALKGYKVVVWHAVASGVGAMLEKEVGETKPYCIIGGGCTVGTKAWYLGYTIGYRAFHFYGFDSSYRNGDNHAYRQALNDGERTETVTVAGKEFLCAPWMAAQAQDFRSQIQTMGKKGCLVTVHGDGLIPFIYRKIIEQTRQAA